MVTLRSFEKLRTRPVHGASTDRCSGLGGDTEQAGNEMSLTDRVTLGQPADSTLVDHVHRFDSLQRPPRALKRSVSFREPDPFLYGSVILLDDIVEVLALAEPNPAGQVSFGLECFDGRRVRPVLIHVHDAGRWVLSRSKHFAEEALGSFGVAFCREQEIDGLARRVHGSIQVPVFALYLYVGLVDAVAFVCLLQVRAAALVHFRCIRLYPSPDAAGIHEQASLGQQFGDMQVRERVAQVPADRLQDHLARVLATLERIRRGDRHGLPKLPDPCPKLRNGTLWSIATPRCSTPPLSRRLGL